MSLKPEIVRGNELTLDMFRAALASSVPAKAHITVNGTVYNQHQLMKKVDSVRALYKAVRTAKTELKKAFAELEAQGPEIARLVKSLQTGIKAYLGEENPDLVKFGFKLDKARMTRELRHTMGSRQKALIKADETQSATPPAKPVAPNGVTGASAPSKVA
jgi:hypothetical protein